VRVAMAQAVSVMPAQAAVPWRQWWQSDTSFMVRRSLVASAWSSAGVSALGADVADSLAVHPDFRMRIAMIEGASSRGGDSLAHRIAARARDADPRVRSAVLTALAGVSATVRDSLGWSTLVTDALRDDDPAVRRAALAALARSAKAADAVTAVDAYQRAARDAVPDARAAALSLIAAAWRRDSTAFTDSINESLRALPAPPEPMLRDRVASVAALSHWRRAPLSAPAAESTYLRIVREVIEPSLRGRAPRLTLDTDRGTVRIALDGVQAPMTSDHLLSLARRGYFRALRFHRVVPAFVAQVGDPRGDGSGGPGVSIRDELNRTPYRRSAVGMALAGPDTGGSQFFLTLSAQPHLDGHYTVFGQVTRGGASMDSLVQGDALRNVLPAAP
jgi:cyclophilin family peptidyl-prolyl cis-trans isomerase